MNSLKAYKLLDYLQPTKEGLMNEKITIALLDMYDGAPNGMRCLIDIINRFSPLVSFDIYDVRGNVNYQKSINTIFIFREEVQEIR
jgi:hypothetical protein